MKAVGAALGLALLLLAASLVIPATPTRAADLTGQYGGVLRMTVLTAPSWDPASPILSDAPIHNLVWDTLARPDPATQEPKPWAGTWVANATTKTVTVTPTAGLKWSNGDPITAADLRATFASYGFSVSTSGTNVVFSFPTGGMGRFFSEALYAWIARDQANAIRYSGMFARDPTNNSRALANANYWAGRPFLDAIHLVLAPSLDDAACLLLKKRVDFIGFPLLPNDLTDERACSQYGGFESPPGSGNYVNKSLVNAIAAKTEPHVSAVHHPGPRFLYYWLDIARHTGTGGVLSDPNFRRALYYFVNKQLAKTFEPSSEVTHALIDGDNAFWFLKSWEVARDAGFTTILDPAGTPRQDTNPYPGIRALDGALYIDMDGDGWRDRPTTGAPFTLRVGVVNFNVDARKTGIVDAYVSLLRREGVNAQLVVFDSWADLRGAETAGSVDMALEVAETATANPRFLETFAPILSAADPQTILHLGLGKDSTSLTERRLHFNHVSFYNSQCACVLPVLHFETLEAYDRNTTTGWVDSFGGINNVWSFAALKQPPVGSLTVALSTFSLSLVAGGRTTVQVVATDDAGAAVKDATVALSATGGLGQFESSTGLTGADGRFQTNWTAPAAVDADTDVAITATVTKLQYRGSMVTTSVAVHVAFRPLNIVVTVANSVLEAPNSTNVQVAVRDSGGQGVAGASVVLTLSIPGGELSPYSGTTGACPGASCGIFTATFTADPSVRSIYRIDAQATKAGYTPGSGGSSVIVTPRPIDAEDYPRVTVTQNVPGFEALAVIAAIGAAVAILRWRSRREA